MVRALLTALMLLGMAVAGCAPTPIGTPLPSPPTLTPIPPLPVPTATPLLTTSPAAAPAWQPASRGIPAQVGIVAVAIVPSDPRVVYLAVYAPGGLYRSANGGDSWEQANGGLEKLTPLALAVHPTNPDVAWVGTALGGYRTSDGGRTWHRIAGLPETYVYALAVTPDGRTLYAGGEASGVWRSDDGGGTWQISQSTRI